MKKVIKIERIDSDSFDNVEVGDFIIRNEAINNKVKLIEDLEKNMIRKIYKTEYVGGKKVIYYRSTVHKNTHCTYNIFNTSNYGVYRIFISKLKLIKLPEL